MSSPDSQRLLDAVPLLVVSCDRDARYVRVNRAYADRFHKTPEELVGCPMRDTVGAAVFESVAPLIARVLAGERVEQEMTLDYPGVGEQTLRSVLTPVRDESGAVIGWDGIGENITDERRLERRGRDLGFLIEHTNDFIGICDLEFRALFVNPAAARMIGADPPLAGVTVFDVIAPEHHEWLRDEFFPRVLRVGRAKTELQFQHLATGDRFWMEYNVVRMDDPSGRPTGYATISRSLVEQKRVEQLLREVARERALALAQFQELADSLPQIVWSAGEDGVPDYFNRQWYMRTLTTRPDDSAPMAFIHPHDRAVLEERWRIAFESGAPLEMEFRMRFPKQPEFRWYLGRTVPVRDDRGHVIRWYGTSTDIDVQKRVESALARSQERLRAALDAAETGTFRWDLRSNALDWDANLARLFGLSSNAAIDKFDDFIALVHPEDRARVAAACDRCRDRGADFDEDFRVRWPNGEVRWLHDKARMYRGADGLPHYLSGACVDVTERRQKEEALVEADRQKDEFLGMLAHELRNPLAPLVYAVASLEQRLPDEKSRKTLDVMSRQVSRISRLVDDLLDVSRVAQGKIALQMQPLDLAVVVRDAVDAVRPGIIERHHQLVLALDDHVMVSGDALRLGQVLVNLLNNAVKYTPEGGRISVSLVGESGAATIRVSDTGIGMSAEMLPRVFDLFVQADSSLTHSQGGLGIGLALVSRLTRLHGGTVTAHSDGPSRGSEFVIRLPLVAPRAIETRA